MFLSNAKLPLTALEQVSPV